MKVKDTVLIDIATCELTLSEVMQQIRQWQAEYPYDEIFMDGDSNSITLRQVIA